MSKAPLPCTATSLLHNGYHQLVFSIKEQFLVVKHIPKPNTVKLMALFSISREQTDLHMNKTCQKTPQKMKRNLKLRVVFGNKLATGR